jgi:hypothetical protein
MQAAKGVLRHQPPRRSEARRRASPCQVRRHVGVHDLDAPTACNEGAELRDEASWRPVTDLIDDEVVTCQHRPPQQLARKIGGFLVRDLGSSRLAMRHEIHVLGDALLEAVRVDLRMRHG